MCGTSCASSSEAARAARMRSLAIITRRTGQRSTSTPAMGATNATGAMYATQTIATSLARPCNRKVIRLMTPKRARKSPKMLTNCATQMVRNARWRSTLPERVGTAASATLASYHSAARAKPRALRRPSGRFAGVKRCVPCGVGLRLGRRAHRSGRPGPLPQLELPPTDVPPCVALVPDGRVDADAAEAERFVQPDTRLVRQRHARVRRVEPLQPQEREQRSVQAPSDAAPLMSLRDVYAHVDAPLICRPFAVPRRVRVPEDPAVVEDQPRSECESGRPAPLHLRGVGRFEFGADRRIR